jgi:acyl-CoA synthetase (NDP forming)
LERDRWARLDRMFHPSSIAVFGAVGEPGKFGHMMLQSLLRYGYRGRIYPISPRGGETLGLKVFRALAEVEGEVDLACVCVPAEEVPRVLMSCLEKGVPGAQILTSGFAETGDPKGMSLQEEVARIARGGIRVLGPNCFGAHCPKGGITIIPGFDFSKEPGPVGVISQSGGVAADFGHEAQAAGIGVSKIISFGNGCDIDASELLDYLADDPETSLVGAYIEGVRDGRRFLQALGDVTRRKPAVLWKGGLTPQGGRAALGHTGSLAGTAGIWGGALTQAGALAVQGLDEMLDSLVALMSLRSNGRKVALIGASGAGGVHSSDLAYRWGLAVEPFGRETQRRLRRLLPTPGNSVANPLDTGMPALPLETLVALMEEVLTREPIDLMIVTLLLHPLAVVFPAYLEMDGLLPPARGAYLSGLLEAASAMRERTGKDMLMVWENRAKRPEDLEVEEMVRVMRPRFQKAGIPIFPSVDRALRAVRNALLRPLRS